MPSHAIQPVDPETLSPWLQGRSFASWREQFDRDGYLIFENVLSKEDAEKVRAAVAPYMVRTGRSHFEGYLTNRVYALLAKAPEVFSGIVGHPLPLAFAEADLGASCLLSGAIAVNMHPGESAQVWHQDDAHIRASEQRPRRPFGMSTFWAIDATTETNGATELLPGSHLWKEEEIDFAPLPDARDPKLKDIDPSIDLQPCAGAFKATVPPGSLIIVKGTLFHRGGANCSDDSRMILAIQYCPGWARQLENMILAIPEETVAGLPKRVQELVGYNIHGAFMGFVDGRHPELMLKTQEARS